MRKMYFDSFANTYTLEKELNAPPERYIATYEGETDDIYIETYQFPSKALLDVAYTTLELESNLVNDVRLNRFEEHGYKNNFLRGRYILLKWIIPKNLFKKYWDMFIDKREK